LLEDLEESSFDEEGNFPALYRKNFKPTTFEGVFFDKDPNRRSLWRNATSTELKDVEKCGVWSIADKKN
jgi:hypothetical protein